MSCVARAACVRVRVRVIVTRHGELRQIQDAIKTKDCECVLVHSFQQSELPHVSVSFLGIAILFRVCFCVLLLTPLHVVHILGTLC